MTSEKMEFFHCTKLVWYFFYHYNQRENLDVLQFLWYQPDLGQFLLLFYERHYFNSV